MSAEPGYFDSPLSVITRHIGKIPVDLDAIAADLGVRVRYVPMGKGVSGSIHFDPETGGFSGFRIDVDSEEAEVRQRFTLAHELAHYVLHSDLIVKGGQVVDNAMYRSSQLSGYYETQANRLAADIIMPKNRVRSAYTETRDHAELASRFQVSLEAMKIRLRYSGLA